MHRYIPVFLFTFFLTLLLGMLLIPLLKKLKAGQTILHYVKEHSSKAGIPTMGGVIFLIAIAFSYLLYSSDFNKFSKVALVITLSYGIVGFLDDYIKIRFKRNLGLRAYQKIIFQVLIAAIASSFVYFNEMTLVDVPFWGGQIDLGVWIIPFSMFVFLATSNSVNLTDGLDGLAAGTSFVCFLIIALLISFKSQLFDLSGDTIMSREYENLFCLSLSAAGGMLGFLCFNSFPAKVFMGDTGSLALGGLIASLAVFSGYSLFIPIIGIMFVVSAVSVIAQVFSFQLFGKRVILMAPYHHHLQQRGYHEAKITAVYMIISLIVSLIVIYFTF